MLKSEPRIAFLIRLTVPQQRQRLTFASNDLRTAEPQSRQTVVEREIMILCVSLGIYTALDIGRLAIVRPSRKASRPSDVRVVISCHAQLRLKFMCTRAAANDWRNGASFS